MDEALENRRSQRAGAAMGVVFVVLFLTAFGLEVKEFPGAGTVPAREIVSFVEAQRFRIAFATITYVLSWTAFLWFLGTARAALVSPDEREGLTDTAFGAGILLAGLFLADTALKSEVLFGDWGARDEVTILSQWAIYDAAGGFFGITPFVRAVFVGATSVAGARRGVIPRWLTWLGLLTVVANGLGAFDYFQSDGWSLTGHPFVDLFAFLGWVLLVSGYLATRSREGLRKRG